MANYKTILRLRPSFGEYKIQSRLIHRGDALIFPPNQHSDVFSTDAQGFRHTFAAGQSLSVRDILAQPRYGVMLGGSKVFGFGLEGNAATIPSLLSERLGFPFANVALPQANGRNLSSLLLAFLVRAPRPPSAVTLVTSGDFTGFCYSSMADPVFGSPNPKILPLVVRERGGVPAAEPSVPAMLAFTSLWMRSIAMLCRSHGIPLILFNDTTFFEKREPSARDIECDLGVAHHPVDARWHGTHKAFVSQFYDRREAVAAQLDVPLVGNARTNDLGFIDEFHYDEDGARTISDDLAATLEPLL